MQMQIPMQTVLTSPPQFIYPVCHNTRPGTVTLRVDQNSQYRISTEFSEANRSSELKYSNSFLSNPQCDSRNSLPFRASFWRLVRCRISVIEICGFLLYSSKDLILGSSLFSDFYDEQRKTRPKRENSLWYFLFQKVLTGKPDAAFKRTARRSPRRHHGQGSAAPGTSCLPCLSVR